VREKTRAGARRGWGGVTGRGGRERERGTEREAERGRGTLEDVDVGDEVERQRVGKDLVIRHLLLPAGHLRDRGRGVRERSARD
jgi:hypothetical protein